MEATDGQWIMKGMEWDNPLRIRTPQELIAYINQVGFLPLFSNSLPGFSVEEHVSPLFWWTDDQEQDPWLWRQILAASGKVAYGKFYNGRAGFVSLEWLPAFLNYRRDGYDFDTLWEDGLANARSKKIMDCFGNNSQISSWELKKLAGFGKNGEKNFDGTLTALQMKGYLVVRDFRRKRRKKDGIEYGWPISIYSTAEDLVGYPSIEEAYREEPLKSRDRILIRLKTEYPWASDEQILENIR